MGRMAKKEVIQEQNMRIEKANDVFYYFSLVYYIVSAIGTGIKFFFLHGNIWDLFLLSIIVIVIMCQLVLYRVWKNSYKYGRCTMITATLIFTIANIKFDGSIVLVTLLPVILLCFLYMSERFLYAMYGVWGANAVICLVQLINEEPAYSREWRDFIIIVGLFILFGISSYMVNNSMALQYNNICTDLRLVNKSNKKYYEDSIVDSTTGLMNRNAYNTYIDEYDNEKMESLCCIFIDVNGLHEYNNTYGHHAGDKMLRRVAISIKDCFSSDKCYRIGGDEFVIFSENMNVRELMDELQNFRAQMESRRIHIAYGMEWLDENMNIKELIKKADLKMYQNKERFYRMNPTGRDRRALYKKTVE